MALIRFRDQSELVTIEDINYIVDAVNTAKTTSQTFIKLTDSTTGKAVAVSIEEIKDIVE